MTAIQLKLPDGWTEVEQPPEWMRMWEKRHGGKVPVPRVFQHNDGRTALVGREPYVSDDEDWRWHISVRYGDPGVDGRVPSWEELVSTAHELRPGVCFVVGVPPKSWWMNVHPNVLHLHETKDAPLVEQFRANARADRPT